MPIHGSPLLGQPAGPDRPYLAINMVASVDGRATLNGSAIGIGSPADKQLLRELRAEADVVLHGAGTVRADPLSARVPSELIPQRLAHGLSEQPVGAIVTRTGNLPLNHPYYESSTIVYVVGQADVEVPLRSTVELCRVADVRAVVVDLHRRGLSRILSEGGPTLNASLLEAGLIDEIFLTIAPKLLGGDHPLPIVNGGRFGIIQLELRSLVELEGELFLKYGVLGQSG